MKKNYVLSILCLLILISCSDDNQSIDEIIDEKEKNEVKVLSPQMKKFITIDSSLYKQFSKDPEFVKTCSTYHRGIRVSGVIDRDRAKAIKTRINQMSVEYKDKYQCNNFLAYVFAYIKENYTSLGSRTSHDWGGCQYYGNDEYVVCNVRKNWDDAWNMYYVEQLDVVGSEDCIEMRAYMAAICDFFDSGYYIPGDNSGFSYVASYFDYGHNYNYSYSEIYSEVTRRSIYYGSHFDDWSIEEMLNYMEFLGWSKEMICT